MTIKVEQVAAKGKARRVMIRVDLQPQCKRHDLKVKTQLMFSWTRSKKRVNNCLQWMNWQVIKPTCSRKLMTRKQRSGKVSKILQAMHQTRTERVRHSKNLKKSHRRRPLICNKKHLCYQIWRMKSLVTPWHSLKDLMCKQILLHSPNAAIKRFRDKPLSRSVRSSKDLQIIVVLCARKEKAPLSLYPIEIVSLMMTRRLTAKTTMTRVLWCAIVAPCGAHKKVRPRFPLVNLITLALAATINLRQWINSMPWLIKLKQQYGTI